MSNEPLHLSVESDDAARHGSHILALLEAANADAGYPRDERSFCAVLRSADGTLRGGVQARSFWGWLYIISIAVELEWRGQGYGRQLLAAAEAWGRDGACHGAWLMTMDFQARTFYERAGYEVFAELPAFPDDRRRLFMRKAIPIATRRFQAATRTETAGPLFIQGS